jgi:hypothetical protein
MLVPPELPPLAVLPPAPPRPPDEPDEEQALPSEAASMKSPRVFREARAMCMKFLCRRKGTKANGLGTSM